MVRDRALPWTRRSLIVELLGICGPSHVSGFIIAVVVNAIECEIRMRTFTNIFKEMLKRLQPPVTDRNSSSAVIGKRWISRIGAALFQMVPAGIFRRVRRAVRASVRTSQLVAKASARSRHSLIQMAGVSLDRLATVTLAHPLATLWRSRSVRDGYQPSETFACHVLGWASRKVAVSHLVSLAQFVQTA